MCIRDSRRLEAYDSSQGEELTEESLRKAGVPEDLVDGLIKSKEHYAEFDTEAYRVWILKAFSRALGSSEEDLDTDLEKVGIEMASVEQIEVQSTDGGDPRETILGILKSNGGELVEYEDLVFLCVTAGSSREDAENAIMSLKQDSMEISEPRFGFFCISE